MVNRHEHDNFRVNRRSGFTFNFRKLISLTYEAAYWMFVLGYVFVYIVYTSEHLKNIVIFCKQGASSWLSVDAKRLAPYLHVTDSNSRCKVDHLCKASGRTVYNVCCLRYCSNTFVSHLDISVSTFLSSPNLLAS